MGGRAAEDLMLNSFTTGAANDISRATEIAKKMVTVFGMSRTVGPISYEKETDHIFLGREFASHPGHSEETARLIDSEVKRVVTDCYETAKRILESHSQALKDLAEALLDYEVLDSKQIDEIIGVSPGAARTHSGEKPDTSADTGEDDTPLES